MKGKLWARAQLSRFLYTISSLVVRSWINLYITSTKTCSPPLFGTVSPCLSLSHFVSVWNVFFFRRFLWAIWKASSVGFFPPSQIFFQGIRSTPEKKMAASQGGQMTNRVGRKKYILSKISVRTGYESRNSQFWPLWPFIHTFWGPLWRNIVTENCVGISCFEKKSWSLTEDDPKKFYSKKEYERNFLFIFRIILFRLSDPEGFKNVNTAVTWEPLYPCKNSDMSLFSFEISCESHKSVWISIIRGENCFFSPWCLWFPSLPPYLTL